MSELADSSGISALEVRTEAVQPRSHGLLLGGAVNAAAPRGNAVDVELHDFAIWEQRLQFGPCVLVCLRAGG